MIKSEKSLDELECRLTLDRLIAKISVRFIEPSDEDVLQIISHVLEEIALLLHVDRSTLFLFADDLTEMSCVLEWTRHNHPPLMDRLKRIPTSSTPWLLDKTKQREVLHISSLDMMPNEQKVFKEILEDVGIKSMVDFPIVYKTKLYGFLGFASTTDSISWSKEIVTSLKTVAEICAGALARREVEESFHERKERAEQRQKLTNEMLAMLGKQTDQKEQIRKALELIKDFTKFDAVGIRLKEGQDYPYYESQGFSADFIEAERYLCARDQQGEIIVDAEGNEVLECMCGNIISGKTDPKQQFFTEWGSFWTSGTTELLASTSEEERQGRTRNRCNAVGYESVALVPLKTADKIIGLLQLNDFRKGMLTPDLISFLEGIGVSIGTSVAHRQVEAALRDSEQWLSTTLKSIGDAVIATDVSGNVVFMNPVAADLTGWELSEAVNRPLSEVFNVVSEETLEPVENPITKILRERKIINFGNIILISEDGTRRSIADSGAPIMDDGGEPVGVVLVFNDMQDQREQEAKLRQHQKLESLGTLAAGVAHEINNPLQGILSYGDLIRTKIDPKSTAYEYANGIVEESLRISTIVSNLLKFSRQEKEPRGPADIGEIVEAALSLTRNMFRKNQIAVSVDVESGLPKINCRTQQIQQILLNLLNNARDSLNQRYADYDKNKIVSIDVSAIENDDKKWIRITVKDRGNGIPKHYMERIFDPFFTTKPRDQGTGLGLSVSHGIAKDHGGHLIAETEEGEYASFHLDLQVDSG
ncbi:MAG: PAS domain S-box protein [Proteobacteria bacterium]|nr:PAS domain S-box protein [Pseudomonadota bacterium]